MLLVSLQKTNMRCGGNVLFILYVQYSLNGFYAMNSSCTRRVAVCMLTLICMCGCNCKSVHDFFIQGRSMMHKNELGLVL